MSYVRDLLAKPAELPLVSKYTIANGLFYLSGGFLLLAWPGADQALLADPPFVGHEAGLIRVIGAALAIVGWLLIFGARSGARQMIAASVIDRAVFTPLVLVPLAMAGVVPHLLIAVAIVDPILGIGAFVLLRRSAAS